MIALNVTKFFINPSRKQFRKILSVSLAIMFGVSLLLWLLVFVFTNNASKKTIREIEMSTAQYSIQNFNSAVELLGVSSSYFAALDTIPFDQMDISSQIKLQNVVKSVINSYLSNHDYISGIRVNIGKLEYSGGKILSDEGQVFITRSGPINLYRLKSDSWKHYFSADTVDSNIYLNSCSIQVEAEEFQRTIFTNTGASRSEYIISNGGDVLLSTEENSISSSAESLFDFPLSDGYFDVIRKDGKDCYCLVKGVDPSCSFYYVSMLPVSYYNSFASTALLQSIGIGIVIVIASLSVVYIIVSMVYRPVKRVADILNQYYPEMDVDINEVDYIDAQISKTMEEKQSLERQLPEALKKLNYAQIVAMQSQIDPHFLFNTLENIKGLSVKNYGVNNEIERAIILLDRIVFESIKQKKILTTVEKEIELTQSYVELMKMRFNNRFDVTWDVDERILKYAIIRFTLQPIIENSILKGFTSSKNNSLSIRIRQEAQDIVIVIQDNGRGIRRQVLEKIRADIEDLDESPNGHVGLKNINMRFKMLYGKSYGIRSIDSSEGQGTTVTLVYPHTELPY